ncbi:coiled coil AKL27 [Puccinia sorghi]|uniref:Coiled coil AKL27 n=1 Tax=Puccinia sorghi TaxID=27349 RepID=A0A0L6VNS7_9BASI|nr:coiled coil AKL27 [Puccinia sorghi]
MIDLILDYNAFYKHSLDKEERAGDEEENKDEIKIIPKKSTTTISLESRGSTPSIVSTLLTSESHGNSMLIVLRRSQILDPENLLWECFETAVDSPTLCDHQDSFWIDSICKELDPDGVNIIQCLCLYKFQCQFMILVFSIIQQDLWKESYTTKPNHSMRRFAMARQSWPSSIRQF